MIWIWPASTVGRRRLPRPAAAPGGAVGGRADDVEREHAQVGDVALPGELQARAPRRALAPAHAAPVRHRPARRAGRCRALLMTSSAVPVLHRGKKEYRPQLHCSRRACRRRCIQPRRSSHRAARAPSNRPPAGASAAARTSTASAPSPRQARAAWRPASAPAPRARVRPPPPRSRRCAAPPAPTPGPAGPARRAARAPRRLRAGARPSGRPAGRQAGMRRGQSGAALPEWAA